MSHLGLEQDGGRRLERSASAAPLGGEETNGYGPDRTRGSSLDPIGHKSPLLQHLNFELHIDQGEDPGSDTGAVTSVPMVPISSRGGARGGRTKSRGRGRGGKSRRGRGRAVTNMALETASYADSGNEGSVAGSSLAVATNAVGASSDVGSDDDGASVVSRRTERTTNVPQHLRDYDTPGTPDPQEMAVDPPNDP